MGTKSRPYTQSNDSNLPLKKQKSAGVQSKAVANSGGVTRSSRGSKNGGA